MNHETSLALIPQSEQYNRVEQVTSENLLDFLIGVSETFPYSKWDFSPELVLHEEISNSLQAFYKEQINVPIYNDTLDTNEIRAVDRLTGNEFSKILSEAEGEAERSYTLYYDSEKDLITTSPIVHGTYRHTIVNTYDYHSDTQFPMLEIHTHPHDVLPSPVDYVRLLTSGYEDGRSVVKGILVLCPSTQILALPLPITSIKEENEVIDNIVQEKNDIEVAHTPILENLNLKITSLSLKGLLEEEELLEQYDRKRMNFTRALIKNKITKERSSHLKSTLLEETKKTLVQIREKNYQDIFQSNLQHADQLSHSTNTFLLSFARKNNIQFFSSQDFTHFKKWSA